MPPDVLQPLIEANARSRRRQLVWLQGDAGWARRQAAQWLAAAGWQQVLWVGTESPEGFEGLDAAQVQRHLGREYEAVVFDAWCGFNPNAFGQSVGTLRGGGLLFLLTPPAAAWCRHDDPEHRSIAVLPYTERDVGHRFLQHLVTQLDADSRVIPVLQHRPLGTPEPLPPVRRCPSAPEPYRTEDQQRAVSAILQALEASVPLVLTADRGRGKSAALGLAAAHWLEQHGGEVLVTAPGQASVTALFERLQARLADAQLHGGELNDCRGRVRYLTPDRLMQGEGDGALLLVDEAAAIPAPVLSRLLARFRRIVFATTLHGYEGTGRGFAVRFRRELQRRTPGWRAFAMSQPIRWCEEDPLEALSFRMLMLDAEPAPAQSFAGQEAVAPRIERLDRERLLGQPQTLSELFGLLVLAHYRTTPGDLRILLDSPNLAVWIASVGGHVAAAMLVVEEGLLPQALAEGISQGTRRPPGHLLPQTLIGQDGLLEAASLRCLRVMRIATHPALERRGIATGLLQALAHWAGPRGCDYLGAGFGATVDLLQFWQRSGYRPVHVGAGRDPVGGTFACMLARPLSAAGHALVEAARAQLRRRLLHQLPAQMRDLDADLVLSLLPSGDSTPLSASEWSEIELFARHNRSFESCEPSLWALCRSGPAFWQRAGLGRDAQYQLIWTLLQRRGWDAVAALGGAGRRAQIRGLRSAMAQLLEAVPPAQRSRTPEGDHDD